MTTQQITNFRAYTPSWMNGPEGDQAGERSGDSLQHLGQLPVMCAWSSGINGVDIDAIDAGGHDIPVECIDRDTLADWCTAITQELAAEDKAARALAEDLAEERL